MLLSLDTLDTDNLLTLVGDILGLLLICHYHESLTRSRCAVQTEHGNRCRRSCLFHLLSTLVEHSLHPTGIAS